MNHVSIIGNGFAAAECIITLRERGYHGTITLFSDNDHGILCPMLTTYYAAKKISYQEMFPYGDDFYQKYHVAFRPCDPVKHLYAAEKRIVTESGYEETFDACLIATGTSAVRPPLEGCNLEGVVTVRTAADAVELRKYADQKPKRVVVMGAAMVGIKVVEIFQNPGCEVVLADMGTRMFPLIATEECASRIQKRLENNGVKILLGHRLEKIQKLDNGSLRVSFGADHPAEDADMVALCLGTRPNVRFIDRDEIHIDRGVVIDTHMRTSAADIYAAGDVSQGNNIATGETALIGLLANAREQGRTAAKNMLGEDAEYFGTLLHNISHFMGMDFVGVGDVNDYDRMEQIDENGILIQLFYKNNKLVACNTLDSYLESGQLIWLITKNFIGNAETDIHEYLERLPHFIAEGNSRKEWTI